MTDFESRQSIIPIQIRPDLVVRVQGIPHDLTEAEAAKIERVIKALASPSQAEQAA